MQNTEAASSLHLLPPCFIFRCRTFYPASMIQLVGLPSIYSNHYVQIFDRYFTVSIPRNPFNAFISN